MARGLVEGYPDGLRPGWFNTALALVVHCLVVVPIFMWDQLRK